MITFVNEDGTRVKRQYRQEDARAIADRLKAKHGIEPGDLFDKDLLDAES